MKAMDAKGIENSTSSYCIKIWCSASLSTDKASREWHTVTDKSAKVGQSAERGNASHTRNRQGHTHWDLEVHARPPTNANQTESGACQSILQCRRKSPQPTSWSREGCRLGGGKSWMGQAEDSILHVCQLTELKQADVWDRYLNRFRRLHETLLQENLGKHCREWPAGKTVRDQASHSKNSKPSRPHRVHWRLSHQRLVGVSFHCQARCDYHPWR